MRDATFADVMTPNQLKTRVQPERLTGTCPRKVKVYLLALSSVGTSHSPVALGVTCLLGGCGYLAPLSSTEIRSAIVCLRDAPRGGQLISIRPQECVSAKDASARMLSLVHPRQRALQERRGLAGAGGLVKRTAHAPQIGQHFA